MLIKIDIHAGPPYAHHSMIPSWNSATVWKWRNQAIQLRRLVELVSNALPLFSGPLVLGGMITTKIEVNMVAGNRGGHGSWQSHRSRIQIMSLSSTYGLMILSQQVILNFCQMGQGWRYRPQESWDRISHVAYPLLLFDFQRRPSTTCL